MTEPGFGGGLAVTHGQAMEKRWFSRPPGKRAITVFTRQFATLLKARVPVVRAIEVLARQERHAGLKAMLHGIALTIRGGGTFSDGLAQHPRCFDRLYVNMVRAGEAGGATEIVMERLALFREKADQTKNKVKAALTYPIIVSIVALVIVSALMVLVVPRFEQIFSGVLRGQPLPALTRAVLETSRFVQEHLALLAIAAAGVAAAIRWLARTSAGTRGIDQLILRLPVIGDVAIKTGTARFARTFATLLASGVPILRALTITQQTCANVHLADALQIVHDRVKDGDSVAAPLAATKLFPSMVTGMIEVGEETGALPEMLSRIADIYDQEVDQSVVALTALLEPLMVVFMAVAVGTIVIALFLPIVAIVQHLQ